ncbi:MAG: type II secretion system protein M [Nitrospirae bacterium]|nr:type II secretion system protein M [Nitrospirota bacterium]
MFERYFTHLKPREKGMIVFGGIAAILILLYAFVLAPAMDRYTTLSRLVDQKRVQYQEILALQKEYGSLKKQHEELEKSASKAQKEFSPLSFMENLSNQARIRDRVISMKPRFTPIDENYRESSIEIKAERLALPQLVTYLQLVENSGMPIKVKTLHIKTRFDDPSLADMTVTVSSYEKTP